MKSVRFDPSMFRTEGMDARPLRTLERRLVCPPSPSVPRSVDEWSMSSKLVTRALSNMDVDEKLTSIHASLASLDVLAWWPCRRSERGLRPPPDRDLDRLFCDSEPESTDDEELWPDICEDEPWFPPIVSLVTRMPPLPDGRRVGSPFPLLLLLLLSTWLFSRLLMLMDLSFKFELALLLPFKFELPWLSPMSAVASELVLPRSRWGLAAASVSMLASLRFLLPPLIFGSSAPPLMSSPLMPRSAALVWNTSGRVMDPSRLRLLVPPSGLRPAVPPSPVISPAVDTVLPRMDGSELM